MYRRSFGNSCEARKLRLYYYRILFGMEFCFKPLDNSGQRAHYCHLESFALSCYLYEDATIPSLWSLWSCYQGIFHCGLCLCLQYQRREVSSMDWSEEFGRHKCYQGISATGIVDFQDCLSAADLTDLSYRGRYLTWSNKSPTNPKSRKLDLVFKNILKTILK